MWISLTPSSASRRRGNDRRRPCAIALLALPIAACQTSDASAPVEAPDAKTVVLAYKNEFFKDPDSIKNASIATPQRHMGFMWHICVRANAKNAFGGYTGLKDMLIGYYDGPKPPTVLMTDATEECAKYPHEPFPELEGGYSPPKAAKGKKGV